MILNSKLKFLNYVDTIEETLFYSLEVLIIGLLKLKE